uniref:GUCT domain-containing protein n=1 Tax=Erpetoichthys calabaricus TaxID=27687 RepID=A0A8C4TJJ6_ERPCA
MKFLKGKIGVCFDVPAASLKTILGSWKDSRRWQPCVATEHPELEEVKRSGERGISGTLASQDRDRVSRWQSNRVREQMRDKFMLATTQQLHMPLWIRHCHHFMACSVTVSSVLQVVVLNAQGS